jgi:hypothetical protein
VVSLNLQANVTQSIPLLPLMVSIPGILSTAVHQDCKAIQENKPQSLWMSQKFWRVGYGFFTH